MNRSKRLSLAAIVILLSITASAAERSTYYYGISRITAQDWNDQIANWKEQGITRAIISVEDGPKMLTATEPQHVATLLVAAKKAGITVEALMLQDPSWALHPRAAQQRLHRLLRFAKNYPGTVDGIQIDVEVYTQRGRFAGHEWQSFGQLLASLRQQMKADGSDLPLSAALPWWVGTVVSSHNLNLIGDSLDSIVLMAYGDPGKPVAADIHAFTERVYPAMDALANVSARLRVGVARYEHQPGAALARHCQELDNLLANMQQYAGVVYFDKVS